MRSYWIGFFRILGVVGLIFSGLVCSSKDPTYKNPYNNCLDLDLDGYGENCLLGPDCDDNNPKLNFSCDCDSVPFEGCPCNENEQESCFEADAEFLSVGVCRQGTRFCENGSWSRCIGQILPSPERCDGLDNNCNGETDEWLNCSDCGPGCFSEDILGNKGTGFDLDSNNSNGLAEDAAGNLVLEKGADQIALTFLWVANSDEGTVSKIDTRTGKEVGRYLSALHNPNDPRNRGHAPGATLNRPSRTAVDFNGDVWVANRAHEGGAHQGTVTKIAHRECIDLNQNGSIETSKDVNGNGQIELDNPEEFLGEADECILFTVDVGGISANPRSLALAAPVEGGRSNAWVGAYEEKKFYLLHWKDGRHIVPEGIEVGLKPYGAAIDSKGILWATQQNTGKIVSIDTKTFSARSVVRIEGCPGSYGIAIDGLDRVWVGGYSWEGACRYNPVDGGALVIETPGKGITRGIAADADGYIWLAHSHHGDKQSVGAVSRFKGEDGSEMQYFDFSDKGKLTIGVGLDFDGRAWCVNRDSDNTCRIDPTTSTVDCYPTGKGTYTYSDFTGYALRNFTAPLGTYHRIFKGCQSLQTRWKKLSWEANIVENTSVRVFFKAADTLEGLDSAQKYGPFDISPVDLVELGNISGEFLWVQLELSSTEEGKTPIVKGLGAQWVCGGEV